MQSPKLLRVLTAALLAGLCTLTAGASIVVDDRFDNGDPTGSPEYPGFWKLQAITGDNGVFENAGYLTLFAVKNPYTFAGLNTQLDDRLDFFTRAVTITVDDVLLEHKGIPDNEAVFRVSINSTELRQNMSPQSVSIRFVPGLALFGYKTNHVDLMAAEDLMGITPGSAIFERFDGQLLGFSLTLDPYVEPGVIMATLILRTNGRQTNITRTARLNLSATDWSSGGKSSLHIEARRNHATLAEDSYMSASVGRVTITNYKR